MSSPRSLCSKAQQGGVPAGEPVQLAQLLGRKIPLAADSLQKQAALPLGQPLQADLVAREELEEQGAGDVGGQGLPVEVEVGSHHKAEVFIHQYVSHHVVVLGQHVGGGGEALKLVDDQDHAVALHPDVFADTLEIALGLPVLLPVAHGAVHDVLVQRLLPAVVQDFRRVPDGLGEEAVDVLGGQVGGVTDLVDEDVLLQSHAAAVLGGEQAGKEGALAHPLGAQDHRVDPFAQLVGQLLLGGLTAHIALGKSRELPVGIFSCLIQPI